jgi:hypothetical protein
MRRGRLQTWRARWFGERDAVVDQLADIARQRTGMARLAQVCASLLLVLFSAGSLVALGGDALLSVLDGAQQARQGPRAAASIPVGAGEDAPVDTSTGDVPFARNGRQHTGSRSRS